ncbi:hypothetical protein [Ornithinimicrobium cavernae]|uniref:hypothetical protein n=1 Tax=Ornithinimicrobium cavernae TaxID=2666047 RepID=UPI000D68599B|nr:hypothetical protein [Ornithinimicrobium cavernae]
MTGLPDRVTRTVGRVRDRVGTAVQQRVTVVRERDREHGVRSVAGDLAFGCGYLVRGPGVPRPAEVAGWRTRSVGGYHYHARARITISPTGPDGAVVLIGRPVDVDTRTTTTQTIADRLAVLAADASGTDAVVRAAAYLGGRWTLFVHGGDGSLTVVTDALASQQVWHSDDGSTLASYASLVPGGTVLPTNSLLEVHGGTVQVRRYWPWDEPQDAGVDGLPAGSSTEAVYEEFRSRIVAHTRLLSDLGRPGVALTGGTRSRAVLAAYLPHRRDGGYAFTHFATESFRDGPGQAEDLFAASALAHRLELPHRVLRAMEPSRDDVFSLAYRRTYPRGDSLASAFARHTLPRDTVELHSAGADIVDLDSWEGLGGPFREGDLAHRVLLPFNDRRLLELMLSVPVEQRRAGALVGRLAAELE